MLSGFFLCCFFPHMYATVASETVALNIMSIKVHVVRGSGVVVSVLDFRSEGR